MTKAWINKGKTQWFFGRPGSGKTTAARNLWRSRSRKSVWLDGDEVRSTLNNDLGYDEADATENIRRIVMMCKLLNEQGFNVIVSVVAPKEHMRKFIRDNLEVVLCWMDTPWSIVYERRKDLYDTYNVLDFDEPQDYDMVIKGY